MRLTYLRKESLMVGEQLLIQYDPKKRSSLPMWSYSYGHEDEEWHMYKICHIKEDPAVLTISSPKTYCWEKVVKSPKRAKRAIFSKILRWTLNQNKTEKVSAPKRDILANLASWLFWTFWVFRIFEKEIYRSKKNEFICDANLQ